MTDPSAFIPLAPTDDCGPDWARRLDRHGEAPALITADGVVTSYRALLAMADDFAARLAPDGVRRFVVLMVRNDVASIAAHIGCLRAGHPVLLFDADGDAARIIADFAPDVIAWPGEGRVEVRSAGGGLHPDLALMLSTSGSTGSPKLVRLSAAALAANAAAIVQYLGIGAGERAVTTLAMHYSFGMSVVNSHLMAGAALIVTDLSVTHPDFADLLARLGPTSLSGVPYLFDLLERSGVRLPPSIRTLTQAGGRMAPDKVRAWAARGDAAGYRFFAMYGQTEAGPRMAWLPPELAGEYPDCIGRPIPGGWFALIDEAGSAIAAAEVAGELVYSGPSVMMGYALSRADLALGAGPAELRTGDIAVRNEAGLYRITGRASRFAKIAGLRIGFDDIEAILDKAGIAALASGDDGLVTVQVEAGDASRIAGLVAAATHIPEAAVAVVVGPAPRLPTGKPDYAAIRRAGAALVSARAAQGAAGAHPILAAYRAAFNRPKLGEDASFESLGGDSLSYVTIAVAVEQAIGRLPAQWEAMPIAALIAEAEAMPAGVTAKGWRQVGTETMLRLLALALVIIGHAAPDSTGLLRGGATILFLMAGYNLARFQKGAFEAGRTRPALMGALERMILPYYLLMIPMLLASQAAKNWGWFALVSVFTVDDYQRGPLFAFWFIESVFHALIVTILLFQVPAVRRWSAASPFATALGLVALGVAARVLVPMFVFDDTNPISLTVDAQYYLYALGWAALVAKGRGQQALVVGLALALTLADYGMTSSRPWWLALALLALFALPTVPLPRAVAGVLLRIASAGYFIYVAHVPVLHVLKHVLHVGGGPAVSIPVLLVSSVVAGLIFERVWLSGYARVVALARR